MATGNLTPKEMRVLAEEVQSLIKAMGYKNVGFILLTYEHGQTTSEANYISTSNREDCIEFMHEMGFKLRAELDAEGGSKKG
jgi:hypothetical protein